MKLLLALSLAALSLAQSTSTATQTQTAIVTLTPAEQCIKGCDPSDVNCQAACVGVPHPGNAQMNDTTSCVAACDQGDGSAQASNAYAACRNACISSYIITSGTGAPGGAYSTAGQTPAPATTGSGEFVCVRPDAIANPRQPKMPPPPPSRPLPRAPPPRRPPSAWPSSAARSASSSPPLRCSRPSSDT